MKQSILAEGPPPLTRYAADAALEAIHFIAAAVRGFDVIVITEEVKPLWRTQLANAYPYLPLHVRVWYFNAPSLLTTLARWPHLNPWEQGAFLADWSAALPHMLSLLEPVLAQAQYNSRQVSPDSSTNAINELNRRSNQAASLQDHNIKMASLTRGLIDSFRTK